MPKKIPAKHPLEALRNALNLSRPQFARRIGTTEHTLEKIAGGRKPSPAITQRILLQYGIDPESLTKGGVARSVLGPWKNIAAAVAAWHDTFWPIFHDNSQKGFTEFFQHKLGAAFKAAVKEKKAMAFIDMLDQFLHKTVDDLNLETTTKVVLSNDPEYATPVKWVPFFAYMPKTLPTKIYLGSRDTVLIIEQSPRQAEIEDKYEPSRFTADLTAKIIKLLAS